MEELTFVDPEGIFWPRGWDTEEDRVTRYPREVVHWCASRRIRKERVRMLCAELDALLARKIRTERVMAGLRQVDLADAIGVTQ